MPDERYTAKLIAHNSSEFQQACQLRYELFFAQHNLPKSIVTDPKQANYFHAAIATDNKVVAYGQLVPHQDRIYQICQMVVATKYQGQGFGKKILLFLIDIARQERAIAIILNARLTAVGFYQKLGFQTYGTPFPSSTTGIMHIAMNLSLKRHIA